MNGAEHPIVEADARPSDDEGRATRGWGPGTLLWLTVVCAAVLLHMQPPGRDPQGLDIGAGSAGAVGARGFSTERALEHLTAIAGEPHPSGSPANARVREYIVGVLEELGYDIELQCGSAQGGRALELVNIIACRGGTGQAGAVDDAHTVMLAAHYDSVAAGPGAADDGAAVAALLEVARVLRQAERPRNDVVILLTDGEEAGLLGAKLFVSDREQLRGIEAVLNFEARGTTGPSLMFETTGDAAWLVEAYARHAPRAVTTSLAAAVYQRMPNDTDLTIFGQAGLTGLNFSFIGSPENYHTERDDTLHLDHASLRHHGVQALAVARALLQRDFSVAAEDPQRVYFTFLWLGVVRYPQDWAVPLCMIATMLLAGTVGFGVTRERVRLSRLGLALLLTLLGLAVVAGICLAAWFLLPGVGGTADCDVLSAGFVLLAAAVALVCARTCGRMLGDAEAGLAALLWCALAGIATTSEMPQASYIIVLPLGCAALAWALLFRAEPAVQRAAGSSAARTAAAVALAVNALAVPAIVLILPVAYLIFVALGPGMAFALSAFVVLLVWTLLPALRGLAPASSAYLAGLLGSAAVVCFFVA